MKRFSVNTRNILTTTSIKASLFSANSSCSNAYHTFRWSRRGYISVEIGDTKGRMELLEKLTHCCKLPHGSHDMALLVVW
jgi:hypothetical protein